MDINVRPERWPALYRLTITANHAQINWNLYSYPGLGGSLAGLFPSSEPDLSREQDRLQQQQIIKETLASAARPEPPPTV